MKVPLGRMKDWFLVIGTLVVSWWGWLELRLDCFFLNLWKIVLAEFWFLMVKEEMERFSSSLVLARRRTYCLGEGELTSFSVGFIRGSF